MNVQVVNGLFLALIGQTFGAGSQAVRVCGLCPAVQVSCRFVPTLPFLKEAGWGRVLGYGVDV